MKLKNRTWLSLVLASVVSIIIWYTFSYPQLAIMNFSTTKSQALTIAKKHLQEKNINPDLYKTAVIFDIADKTNTYLQKKLSFKKLKTFISNNQLDLFQWKIRFFQEEQAEEYKINVSSSSGEIIFFQHKLESSAQRDFITKDEARAKSLKFLKNNFQFNENENIIFEDREKTLDNRTDYEITWAKKDIQIPWSVEANSGTAKMLNFTFISGNEILLFSKNVLNLPDQFNRYLEKLDNSGRALGSLSTMFFYILLSASVYFLVLGHQHISVHITKSFYLRIAGIIFVLTCISNLSQLQPILYEYKTSNILAQTLSRYFITTLMGTLLVSLSLILPFLAGEYLHSNATKSKPKESFSYYIRTSFLTRDVSKQIWVGYFLCIIMLGLQALLIKFGQDHLNVWVSHIWLENLSSASLPFITALAVSLLASFNEEALYRFFAIKWGGKLFKNVWIPVLLSSLIWGFAHSGYPVYPKWFRGIELTFIGILLGFSYLRFGIIPVIVAHFLFDIFWNCSSYLFGNSNPLYFSIALILLLIPFILSIICYLSNKKPILAPLKNLFSKKQIFDCQLLKAALAAKKQNDPDFSIKAFRSELTNHNWDPEIIKSALYDEDQKNESLA